MLDYLGRIADLIHSLIDWMLDKLHTFSLWMNEE